MNAESPFYRVRWTLHAKSGWNLHTHQHAILYAVLCDAVRGEQPTGPSHMPEWLLLDAPEGGRDTVDAGESFAFGATLIEADPIRASERLHRTCGGLMRLGRVSPKKPVALGGNFDLIDVEDLVAGRSLSPDESLTPLARTTLSQQIDQLGPLLGQPITIRFISPLRLELPEAEAADGHRYADGSRLIIGQLLRAVQKRLAAVGIRRRAGEDDPLFDDSAITLIENRLVWLDLEYGRRDLRKSLGGAMGRIRIVVHEPAALAALVWGQYTRVGRNLHFGFGNYRIEEVGPNSTACPRSCRLLDLALRPVRIERIATEYELDPLSFREAAERLREGTYIPHPPNRIVLREPDGGRRELNVPTRQDRGLQRLLLSRLAPACDRLFETSSFAWRKGLSREAAARRIERLANDGWTFAVRADFDRFFDRIPQPLLRDRLEAWIGDEATIDAVMAFVRTGTVSNLGIPTGAPLSPLLGNLMLDHFDEQIELAGGRLVRYADDFLILTRSRNAAESLHQKSIELATELELQLNADSVVIDLREPFDFLGFQFRQEDRWRYDGANGPRRVRELGWKDADRTPSPLQIALPGEAASASSSGVLVLGPGVERIDVVGGELQVIQSNPAGALRESLTGLDGIIVVGPTEFTADAPGKLLRSGVPVYLISEGGWPLGELSAFPPDDPDALLAQCRAVVVPERVLELAKPLVRAKLLNFAALAQSLQPGDSTTTGPLLALAAAIPTATTLDALRGFEGAGAAAWYRALPGFLGSGFRFTTRVSPDANDPVNIMLNIGYTMLHRHAVTACRAAGLSPAIGFLHSSTPRYAALAADLQEPFRHLVERAVILASRRLKPTQFLPRKDGPYPLVMEHHASKLFHAVLQRSWRSAVVGRGQSEPRAWLGQMLTTARSLRRHLIDPTSPWEPFEHP